MKNRVLISNSMFAGEMSTYNEKRELTNKEEELQKKFIESNEIKKYNHKGEQENAKDSSNNE